ncbi:MAG: anhydro-N-acetylmuramic acid kinase [Phormidesmis sp.]
MKVIGLMSGTSVDGVDAALTEISGSGYAVQAALIKGITHAYSEDLRSRILALCADEPTTLAELAELDDAITHHFVQSIHALDIDLTSVELIGSHGQTLYHRPPQAPRLGYTLQLGRGDLIAQLTGCQTISNFRVADIALGGQGAPLVPLIDACLFSQPDTDLAVQNIGGIGNLTYLPSWNKKASSDPISPMGVRGWDTGPGNALIDWAVTKLSDGRQNYDHNGEWAAQGAPHRALIERWLQQPFFHLPPPKSTGRELFGAAYAQQCWQSAQAYSLSPEDFLATLADFTAATIELSYRRFLPAVPGKILVGGGGSRNQYLMSRLQSRLPESSVLSTEHCQIDADYKEAIAFAILAYWRSRNVSGNLPSVTGASRPCLLGEVWTP